MMLRSTDVNKAILIGRLGQDPEVKTFDSGNTIVTLRIATSDRKKVDGEWQDATEWHTVKCFGKTADLAAQYLAKGRQVAIEGKIQTRQYEKDGIKRYATEILCDRLEFIGSRGEQAERGDAYEPAAKPAGPAPAMVDDGLDVPF